MVTVMLVVVIRVRVRVTVGAAFTITFAVSAMATDELFSAPSTRIRAGDHQISILHT